MFNREILFIVLIALFINSCGWNLNAPDGGNGGTDPDTTTMYMNVTSSNLPGNLTGTAPAAKAGDIDNDGDLDLVLAIEFQRNRILINNGNGSFTDGSSRLPAQTYDSQDLTIADLNRDGNLDIFAAGNQNQTNELFINNGTGNFSDLSNRIPVSGNSTASEASDIDGDGSTDILIGNLGQNVLLMNSGNAFFNDQTIQRMPQITDRTQDIKFADITGDNLRDIVVGNEDANRVYINTGSGFFADQTSRRISLISDIEETHDISIADVDGDSDLDIYFGNTGFQEGSNPQDRLLINNGQGFFSDQTADRLPAITTNTFDAEFADIDRDGDRDLVVGNYNGGIRILINNGNGYFSDQSGAWIPDNLNPRVLDLEIADYNGDSASDLYISVENGQDQLLIHKNN